MIAERLRLAEIVHQRRVDGRRAFEEVFPRQAEEGRGHESHRRKHGVAPAQMVRDRQGHDVVAVRFLAQVAFLLVRDEQHVLVPRIR